MCVCLCNTSSYSPTRDSPDEACHKSLLLLTESALLFRLNALCYTYQECIAQKIAVFYQKLHDFFQRHNQPGSIGSAIWNYYGFYSTKKKTIIQ